MNVLESGGMRTLHEATRCLSLALLLASPAWMGCAASLVRAPFDSSSTDTTPDTVCLRAEGTPRAVSFPAGSLVDPNGDLNPATEVRVDGD